MSMKKIFLLLLAATVLCACEPSPTGESVADSAPVSQAVETSCTHEFGDEPVEIVGNLYVYECALCGEREVVPQGTLIGGEE